jgi:thiamine-phosphate pyrophosphorylase
MHMRLVFPQLYVIMDTSLLTISETAFAQMLAESGVELVQYRSKAASSRDYFEASQALAQGFRSRGIRFIVNDRADVAALAGADGVHVGQEDLGIEEARAIVGKDRWVGVSTHNLDQFRLAAETSADYIAVGPIFSTTTKQNPDPIVGLEFIRNVRPLTAKPLVAIGGITLERAASVLEAGADCVAVASDICRAPQPAAQVRRYLERLGAAQTASA